MTVDLLWYLNSWCAESISANIKNFLHMLSFIDTYWNDSLWSQPIVVVTILMQETCIDDIYRLKPSQYFQSQHEMG